MKRKAIQLAKQTIVVSLPAKWIRQQGIKKGDEIDVVEESNRLIIGEAKKQEYKKKELDVTNYPLYMLHRHLRALYRIGYDELILTFKDIIQLNEIEKIRSNLIGFELVEQSKNKCIMKDISNMQITHTDIDKLVKRVFIILISMCEELQNKNEKLKLKNLKELETIDKQINRHVDYIIRLINKNIIQEKIKSQLMYFTAMQLEYVGDIFRVISKKTIELNLKKYDPITIKLLDTAHKAINLLSLSFYNPNKFFIKETDEIKDSVNLTYKEINKSKISKQEIEICGLIKDIVYKAIDTIDEIRVVD